MKKSFTLFIVVLILLCLTGCKKTIQRDENFIWAQEIVSNVCDSDIVTYFSVKEEYDKDLNFYGFYLENQTQIIVGVNRNTQECYIKGHNSDMFYQIKIDEQDGIKLYSITDTPM